MRKSKKLLFVPLIALISFATTYSQENVVKVGLGGLVFGNLKAGYERIISDNQSLTINAGMLIPRELPGFIEIDSELEDIDSELSSFSLSAEYRFYTGDNVAPRGFYLAPYARLNNFSFKFNDVYDGNEATVDSDFSTLGIGLQLGYQWVISDLVTIDWYFFGLGLDRDVYSAKFTSDEQGFDYAELEEDIRTEVEDIPIIGKNFELETGDDYVKCETSFLFPGLRAGLSIGIIF